MLREEKVRIIRKIRNSIDKIDNLVDKGKRMFIDMWREGKVRTVDPIGKERENEKRQERISGERQRLAKILKTFNDAREVEIREVTSIRDLLRSVKNTKKIIPKYINFWAKDGFLLENYLIKWIHLWKNEKDTAQWFNLEDIKNANDLRQCWKFIKEWKKYLYNYKKLMWGEKTGRKVIYEKMWSEIRDYYYKDPKWIKKIDKAMRYEIIAEKFNKEYKPLLPGKNPPVPQEDAFWRKFYSIKDKYSKKAHGNKN